MSELIEFMVIDRLENQTEKFYQASNGIRLVLAADGTLWFSCTDPNYMTQERVNQAMVELLK